MFGQETVLGHCIPGSQKDVQAEDRISVLVAGREMATMLLGIEAQSLGEVDTICNKQSKKDRQQKQKVVAAMVKVTLKSQDCAVLCKSAGGKKTSASRQQEPWGGRTRCGPCFHQVLHSNRELTLHIITPSHIGHGFVEVHR